MLSCGDIIKKLKLMSDPETVQGMARFGISRQNTLGVSIPRLRNMARLLGREHRLAEQLWKSGIHEARILATMVDDPKKVSTGQMERWVKDFDSWDVCDQCCSNLFAETVYAYRKAVEWSRKDHEFVKRAGFVLMAVLAVHDKKARDENFLKFFSLIKKEATDERNFVKKAVNWALRQIGKRNLTLNKIAVMTAREIKRFDSPSAKWIASDAQRELESESVQKRMKTKNIK
jgi:3-methyladenine DNA glycosylase AlkD